MSQPPRPPGLPFPDHFSGHADAYARHRPTYPEALFDHLADQAPGHQRAWDVGTGNGQAARSLARRFGQIVATDASPRQLAHAPGPGSAGSGEGGSLHRVAALAEAAPLATGSVDLVIVAQALHWFDAEAFWNEVGRVGRSGAVVAAWCYGLLRIEPAIDRLLLGFYEDEVGPFWPPERRHIDAGYATLPFPFEPLEPPADPAALTLTLGWSLDDLLGYLGTWSAVRRYEERHGHDPVARLAPHLEALWTDGPTERPVHWPLHLLAGRVE